LYFFYSLDDYFLSPCAFWNKYSSKLKLSKSSMSSSEGCTGCECPLRFNGISGERQSYPANSWNSGQLKGHQSPPLHSFLHISASSLLLCEGLMLRLCTMPVSDNNRQQQTQSDTPAHEHTDTSANKTPV